MLPSNIPPAILNRSREMRRGFIGATLLAFVAGFLVLVVPPAPAQASAFGCVGNSVRGASSCVRIWGNSTWVDNAAAGVSIGPRTWVRGYVKLYRDGHLIRQSPMFSCHNGAWDKTNYCEWQWTTREHWRNGANVCGQFIFDNGQALSWACKRIIR